MGNAKLIGILQQHGENDYSIWHPDVSADDPTLKAFLDKHEASGCSVRGSAAEISTEIAEILPTYTAARVHVIVYHDFEDDYIGLDVFNTYEAARICWVNSLKSVIELHGDDWIDEMERNEAERKLYYNTENGYECFYMEESIQRIFQGAYDNSKKKDACASKNGDVCACAYCGAQTPSNDIDAERGGIFVCENEGCGKHFCTTCYEGMTGCCASEERIAGKMFCPDCLLETSVRSCVSDWLSDYASRMPESFYQSIIIDVKESSGFSTGEGFNDDDIKLAFSRVIAQKFGVEV